MTTKKSKILPIKVWIDEESCWNNKPQYSEGYVEYVREDYHAQALLHVLQKGVRQGKREFLDKIKSLIKEWELCTSAEAKYKVEAYKELIELIEKEDKE